SSGGLTINGFSQPGSQPNTDPLASNAVISIEIRGNGDTADAGNAFKITSPNNRIQGLSIYNTFNHIDMTGPNASGNIIVGNIFGLTPSGLARLRNGWNGIDLQWGASLNYIGGVGDHEHNVIAAAAYAGVDVSHGQETTKNRVVGNFIGTSLDGESVQSYTKM